MKIQKILGVFTFIVLAAVCTGCGGGSGSSSNDAADTSTTFTATDAHNVGAAFNNAQSAAWSDVMTQYGDQLAATWGAKVVDVSKGTRSGTINLNNVYNCYVAGHITQTGNINWSYTYPDPPDYVAPAYSFTVNGQIEDDVSDPTNNLNDCEVGEGVILDGTIYSQLTISGDESSAHAQFSMDGIIGINKRGPTGGLVMIADDCRIFLTIVVNSTSAGATGSANGTVCDQTYSYSF
jgi:hypothetical protein